MSISSPFQNQPKAVLFDLDGTLVDSAPDLAGALNALRAEQGLAALPLAQLRPVVGMGARGLIGQGLGVTPQDDAFALLRDRFLALYAQGLLHQTALFPEMPEVLAALDRSRCAWGIVTNKATCFAQPITQGLGLGSAVLVCGDTTPFAKPHPQPLLHACAQIGVSPNDAVYVGDDLRDIVAGRAAGMRTVAAAWGYLGLGEPVDSWGADVVLDTPAQLLKWLNLA